jgi:hypothetical protein
MKFNLKARSIASALALAFASVPAFADGTDPTSSITTTLATYATDVGTIAAAVLLIVYGKKLVSYLRV